ncbi:MAG: TolC family outer membrane protein [Betaproteobacteria bacterium]|nr:TolC family outer membrane protein [Betaproteobacteria bacterium]
MNPRLLALVLPVALCLVSGGRSAAAEDLMQIYREAQLNDPAIAAAKAQWLATQERMPQAKAGLLPSASLTGGVNANNYDATIKSEPAVDVSRSYNQYNATISASQPLFRWQNKIAYDQAKEVVAQAEYVLGTAQQDLILKVAVAYFDVLLAEFNIELAEAQKAATSEQLALAKRNFEVGVATIIDTNEAQAKFDQIVAAEISARNDYDNKLTALRAIIGRFPKDLKKVGPGLVPKPPEPNALDYWVDRATSENLNVRIAQINHDIAALEVERAKAGHYPTLDLVGSYGAQGSSAAVNTSVASDSRSGLIGLQLAVPIYQGGAIESRVREAVALKEKTRQDLESARRAALFNAQNGFSGVNSAVASVRAFEQALVSAQTAYDSNKLGLEVGVRTNLDVLNVQQAVYSTRRDVAQAYFNYLTGYLRLKAATGSLSETDLEDINRQLKG